MTRLLIGKAAPVDSSCCRFFSQSGYEVATATTVVECLADLDLFRPHVLVLDLHLPGGGADKVLDWLRSAGTAQPLPAVVLIGEEPASFVTRTLLTSPVIEAYLESPCCPSVLLDVVHSVADAACQRAMWVQRGARPPARQEQNASWPGRTETEQRRTIDQCNC